MRIGIITFFQSDDNYGQLLQGYALQSVLKSLGHYPYTIRYGFHKYLQPVHGEAWPVPTHYSMIKRIRFFFSSFFSDSGKVHIKPGTEDNRGFDEFRSMHLNLSQYVYNNIDDLRKYPPLADCYLTGSDQVWAQLLSNKNNKAFFLDFGHSDTRRVAYAPSFALDDYPQELNSLLAEQLKKIDFISVREKSGVDICHKVGYDATLVLDPTLLLTGRCYKTLSKESQTVINGDYCFAYHVNITNPDHLYWKKFKAYNDEHGLRTIAVYANKEPGQNMEILDGAEYMFPNIQEWIKYIRHSTYVLTSSFHGAVFAILFHKPFFICLRPNSQFAGNDRVLTLLSSLGLEDRIVNTMDYSPSSRKPISWSDVDSRLALLRKKSMSFLKESLSKTN